MIELKQHLLSLCTPKLKILVKASKGKGIEANDVFTFNAEFTSKLKRIKVPLISVKEVVPTEEEAAGDSLPSTVEEDRRHLVEAAIVRIMKSRKTLSHLELVAEVTRQLSARFVPNPQVSLDVIY
jgi:cullin 3